MPVTIRQLAEECGVSRQAVSYALTNSGRLREETRERIIASAQRLGYRPNASAKMMRSGRFNAIGLLLSTRFGRGFIFERTSFAIRSALREKDLQLLIGDLPDEKLTDETVLPRVLREWLVDGLLISYTHHIPEGMVELIDRYRIPAVWLNAKLDHDCIYPDDHGAGRLGARRLLELGHQRLAFLRYGGLYHYSGPDRQQGFAEAVADAGLSPQVHAPADPPPRGQRLARTLAWLDRPDRPTGVVCYEAEEALTLYAAATRLGLRIPEDLSILAIAEVPVTQVGVDIDTIRIPSDRLGREAVEMVLTKTRHPKRQLRSRALPFETTPGATVAPPPGG